MGILQQVLRLQDTFSGSLPTFPIRITLFTRSWDLDFLDFVVRNYVRDLPWSDEIKTIQKYKNYFEWYPTKNQSLSCIKTVKAGFYFIPLTL